MTPTPTQGQHHHTTTLSYHCHRPYRVQMCRVCHFTVNPASTANNARLCLAASLPLICDEAMNARCTAAITVMSLRPSHTLKPARGAMCRGCWTKGGRIRAGLACLVVQRITKHSGWWELEGASRQRGGVSECCYRRRRACPR